MDYKQLFQLDPEIIFLNHGSFGACPRPVFEVYQNWQKLLEHQPVEFLGRKCKDYLYQARSSLSTYLGVTPDDLVFFPNPTTALNMVARNLVLKPGDQILATNHEYGAMDRTWRYYAKKKGAIYRNYPIQTPVTDPGMWLEEFWSGVNEHTKVIFTSHITSPTGLVFPVASLCKKAREFGILTIIDGAHAPGQIPLNLTSIGASIYTGALHKWLCAPKGAAFLYAERSIQEWLDPLVISWGYDSEEPSGSKFIDYHEWQGTRDLAAYLSVPDAIRFQDQNNWEEVRKACHELCCNTGEELRIITGCEMLSKSTSYQWYGQMVSSILPQIDTMWLKEKLYSDYRIEVPVYTWNSLPLIRVSFQAYNSELDAHKFIRAIRELLIQNEKIQNHSKLI
jgi:isopenicillin-N epimerase